MTNSTAPRAANVSAPSGTSWYSSSAREVDPTGAGDVFAAAFLTRYNAGGDPWEAAQYAAVAGALTVEAPDIAGIPTAEQLAARWRAAQPR